MPSTVSRLAGGGFLWYCFGREMLVLAPPLIDAENWEDCSEHSFSLLAAWKLDKLTNVWSPLVFVRLTTHKGSCSYCLLKRGNFILQFTFSTHMITFPAMRLSCLITCYYICLYSAVWQDCRPWTSLKNASRGEKGAGWVLLDLCCKCFLGCFDQLSVHCIWLPKEIKCVLVLAFLYLVFFCCVCEQWKGLLFLSLNYIFGY